MKAYLIDPFAKAITEVEYDGDYRQIYKLIGCDTFTALQVNEHGDTLWLDDEGLFKSAQSFFRLRDYPNPLAGKALLLGSNDEGDSVAPIVDRAWLERRVSWVGTDDVRAADASGAFDLRFGTMAEDGTVVMEPLARVRPQVLDDEDEGWISWPGGERPDLDPATVVQVRFRPGQVSPDRCRVSEWYWRHDGEDRDIVAYRVVEARPEAGAAQ